jgi:hypothetical protein
MNFRRNAASDVTHVVDTLLSDSSITLDRHRLALHAHEALYARQTFRVAISKIVLAATDLIGYASGYSDARALDGVERDFPHRQGMTV